CVPPDCHSVPTRRSSDLNNTKSTATTLDKELDYVSTYLAIQKLRFSTKFDYIIRIDKRILPSRYRILPLLIQPIVENAVSHGLRSEEHTSELQSRFDLVC